MVKSHREWRDEFRFPVLHDHVEEQRRVMFLQTWPRGILDAPKCTSQCRLSDSSPYVKCPGQKSAVTDAVSKPSGPFLNWCCRQVSIRLFEVVCCGNTVQDEKSCPYIRSFHSSALPIMEYSPNAERPYSSPACSEPIWTVAWVPGRQPTSWGAGREAGVSTMRGPILTFSWMSDLTGTSFDWTEAVGWQLGLIDVYQAEEASTAIGLWKHRIPSDLRS